MSKQKHHADPAPLANLARQEPRGFLGDISIPNQHVLTERDVGPEHHAEREEQLANVLIVLRGDDALEVAKRLQAQAHNADVGEAAGATTHEEIQAKHGAKPRGVQAHNPVKGGEGCGESKHNCGGTRPLLQFLCVRDGPVAVLRH